MKILVKSTNMNATILSERKKNPDFVLLNVAQ